MSTEMIKNPYPGPEPFNEDQRHLFFGRKREERDIVALIEAQPTMLLYGRSGTGKTSLLKASIIPRLRDTATNDFNVLPTARVQGRTDVNINDVDPDSEETCIYMLNVFALWSEKLNISYTPHTTLLDCLQQIPRGVNELDEEKIFVVIFDQFEEIYTAYQTHWRQREVFFKQVASALKEIASLRVVFSMREDYIAEFYRHSSLLPNNVRARFQLQQLTKEQAELAITKPAESLETGKRSYTNEATKALLEKLLAIRSKGGDQEIFVEGEFAEPVVLQVVCQKLWNSLSEEQNKTTITIEDIDKYADIANALTDFYHDCIRIVVEKTSITELELRRWFGEKLIVADSLRHSVRFTDKDTGGLPNDVVTELQNMHIIRREEQRGGAIFELAHDLFVQPIVDDNQAYFAELAKESDAAQSSQETEMSEPTHRFRLPTSDRSTEFTERVETTVWQYVDQARRSGDIPYEGYLEYMLGLVLLMHFIDEKVIEIDIDNDNLGNEIDKAIRNLYSARSDLLDVFPDNYSRLKTKVLHDLLHRIANLTVSQSTHTLTNLFAIILELATEDGRKTSGDITTPSTLAELMIRLADPSSEARIYDPMCRSGRFFVDTKKFLQSSQNNKVSIVGVGINRQEQLTRIARMNMALSNLKVDIRSGNAIVEPSIQPNSFDIVFCNPPFNDDTHRNQLQETAFLPFGPTNNGNLRWMQHFVASCNSSGRAVFLMPNSVADSRSSDNEIIEELVRSKWLEVVISVGTGFFYSGGIPAMIWVIDKEKTDENILLVDTREIFEEVSRSRNAYQRAQVEFINNIVQLFRAETINTQNDIENWITSTFPTKQYRDVLGLCKSITIDDCMKQDWHLNPGRYVGIAGIQESMSHDEFLSTLRQLRDKLNRLNLDADRASDRINRSLRSLLGDA